MEMKGGSAKRVEIEEGKDGGREWKIIYDQN